MREGAFLAGRDVPDPGNAYDKRARIWDVMTGEESAVFAHQDSVSIVAFTPVPMLRRKAGPRRLRIMGQRHAKRLPKGMKPIRPGELVQIDTLSSTSLPTRPSSTSRLTTRWR